MTKEAPALFRRERVKGCGQGGMKVFQCSGSRLAQMGFEFGESQFNGIEIGAVGRQVTNSHSVSPEQSANVLAFVSGEVVQNQRIALTQLRTKHLLQIHRENLGIDGTFNPKWGFDAFMAQGCNKSGSLPVTVWNGPPATLPYRTAPVTTRHRGI